MATITKAGLKKRIATDLAAAYPGCKVESVTIGLALFLPPVGDHADFLLAVNDRNTVAKAVVAEQERKRKRDEAARAKAVKATAPKARSTKPKTTKPRSTTSRRSGVIKPKPPTKPRRSI